MSEDNMRVYVFDSTYNDETDGKLIVNDVNPIPFLNCINPLYIGARQGQVERMRKLIDKEKLGGNSIGYWNLTGNPGYVTKKGKLNLEAFKAHDVIMFADPSRVHEQYRAAYVAFIDAVKQAL